MSEINTHTDQPEENAAEKEKKLLTFPITPSSVLLKKGRKTVQGYVLASELKEKNSLVVLFEPDEKKERNMDTLKPTEGIKTSPMKNIVKIDENTYEIETQNSTYTLTLKEAIADLSMESEKQNTTDSAIFKFRTKLIQAIEKLKKAA